jgi:hypothetical protein
MLPTCNLPTPHALELATHVVDRLVEFVDLVMQVSLAWAVQGGGDGAVVGVTRIGEPAQAPNPLLTRLKPAPLGFRQQPPGQPGCTENGPHHGADQKGAAGLCFGLSSHGC